MKIRYITIIFVIIVSVLGAGFATSVPTFLAGAIAGMTLVLLADLDLAS